MKQQEQQWMSFVLIIGAAAIWGGGFVFVKWLLPFANGLMVHHLRFILAGSTSALILLFAPSSWRAAAGQSLVASLVLYAFLTLQTIGLEYTTVAKSGFLTTLYVLFTPLILSFRVLLGGGQPLKLLFWLSVLLAIFGMWLLAGADLASLNLGDYLTIGCALLAAIHILLVEYFQPSIKHPFGFNCMQCCWTGLWSIIGMGLTDQWPSWDLIGQFDQLAWMGLVGLGIFSSILAFGFQVWAQQKIPSHTAAVLFLLESPFAALFGFWLLSETLSIPGIIGCVLILVACLLALKSLRPNEREHPVGVNS